MAYVEKIQVCSPVEGKAQGEVSGMRLLRVPIYVHAVDDRCGIGPGIAKAGDAGFKTTVPQNGSRRVDHAVEANQSYRLIPNVFGVFDAPRLLEMAHKFSNFLGSNAGL